MYEIQLTSSITSASLEEIKLLSLYYDKIYIADDAVFTPAFNNESKEWYPQRKSFLPQSFVEDYKLLIDEHIVEVIDNPDNNEFAKEVSHSINKCEDIIFPLDIDKNRVLTEEILGIFSDVQQIDIQKDGVNNNFIWWYYAKKLQYSIKSLCKGETTISSSNNLNQLINHFVKENNSFNALIKTLNTPITSSEISNKIIFSLPSPRNLSFEDILYLKSFLRDERLAFQYELSKIKKEALEYCMTTSELNNYCYANIEKPLQDLKDKSKGIANKSFEIFVKSIKNPLSYSPLIGTISNILPLNVIAALSVGIMTADATKQYIDESKKLKANGLHFLLRL